MTERTPRTATMLLLALLAAQTAWAWDGSGTADSPYLIKTTADLDLLAHRVNGTHGETANDYNGKHFRLEADLVYDPNGLGDTGSNYEAIGGYFGGTNERYFLGTFDGQNHVVSGIRIYKGGSDDTDDYQGLFGRISSPAEVKNVILADASITGNNQTGAIVGENIGGTVTNCHALANVTVHNVQNSAWNHAGIAGFNSGTVTRCTSAAAITSAAGITPEYVGGIAGTNGGINDDGDTGTGTISDCIYLGTTLEGKYRVGAIAGCNFGTVENSYYTDTAIQGKDKSGTVLDNAASAVGCNIGGTVAATVGPALSDDADNSNFFTLMAARTTALTAVSRTAALANAATVGLHGRTLYKDGSWNTLCLPFDVTTTSGTLSGNNVQAMTLDTETSNLADGTLTLNFTAATTIPAGTPFIIKWDGDGSSNITAPVFEGVTIDATRHDTTVEDVLTFTGTYAPVSIPDGGDNTKLYLGSDNTLYYPTDAMTIGCQRAYFQLADGITVGEPTGTEGSGQDVRAFILNFGDDEATGIITTNSTNSSNEWYSLDGVKLAAKPTAKGLYIHGGKKVVIK